MGRKSNSAKRRRPRRLRSRRSRGVLFTGVGVVCLVLAIAVLAKDRAPAEQPAHARVIVAAQDDMVLIPVPQRNIARGESIADVPVTYIKWPRSQIAGQFVTEIKQVVGRVSRTPLSKLSPIPIIALDDNPHDSNAVVEGIPEGMRAITVKVDAESAVEGWARSGNFIDVIVIRRNSSSRDEMEARVIAENVRILSAGRSVKPVRGSDSVARAPATVTLLVSQRDALRIKTAASIGKITFALRGEGDGQPTLATKLGKSPVATGVVQSVYRGYATGPDGRKYILNQHGRWLPTFVDPPQRAVDRTARAQLATAPIPAEVADELR